MRTFSLVLDKALKVGLAAVLAAGLLVLDGGQFAAYAEEGNSGNVSSETATPTEPPMEGNLGSTDEPADVVVDAAADEADTLDVEQDVASKAEAEVATDAPKMPAKLHAGWNKTDDGRWLYGNSDGSFRTGWLNLGGTWYWLDPATGIMATGWLETGGSRYYLDGSGAMLANRWAWVEGKCYYFNPTGRVQSGWINWYGTWYWLEPSDGGAMTVGGWLETGGSRYYLDGSGAMLANRWAWFDGKCYYFNPSGRVQTGWVNWYGTWYWLEPSDGGAMTVGGWLRAGGSRYYLDGSGAMLANRWAWVEGKCYYFNPTGRVQSGWINWYGTWYWLEPSDGGAMATGLADVGSRKCYFGADGAMRTGWQKLDGSWYYFNASGYMQTGWVNVGGGRYWLADDGKMFADGLKEIAGKLYSFTSSGAVRTNCILRLENDECGFADATGAISKIGYYDGNDIVFRNADGTPKSGWQLIGGKYFYAQPGTGVMHKGWLQLGNTWYYLNDNGVMVTGLQTIRGYRYYFLGSGAWVGNTGNAELNDYINTIIVSRGTNLRTLFNYVASYPYRNGSKNPTGNWSVPFALEMYRNGGGNCYRYAALFCELAKAVGYDARVVAGSVPSYSAGWAPHGWVEIRMNGTTYVCDPDLQHEIPSRNWYMFTYGQAPTNYRY